MCCFIISDSKRVIIILKLHFGDVKNSLKSSCYQGFLYSFRSRMANLFPFNWLGTVLNFSTEKRGESRVSH